MSKIRALIPNLLTAGNLLGGVLAIIFSLTGRLEWAPYCIFISAFLDFFDGFAARLLKVQSELGKQLDSLADMVTFGVAPGVMMFVIIKAAVLNTYLSTQMDFGGPYMTGPDSIPQMFEMDSYLSLLKPETDWILSFNFCYNYLPFFALLIPVMSMFRLAKFNLDTRQSESFIGLPTPANTLFFAALPLILIYTVRSSGVPRNDYILWIIDNIVLNYWVLCSLILIMSFLLVAELPLFALKFKSFGWKGNEIRYIFLTLAVILLATLQWLAIPLIIILYILLSLIQNLRLRQKGYGE